MKRHMILAVAAVLAVAAAGPAFADPASGARGDRGTQTRNHDSNKNWDDDDDNEWEDDWGWEEDDGCDRDGCDRDGCDHDGGWRGDRHGTPRIDRWERRLEMKIRQGMRSGALNRREATRLRDRLAHIHHQEAQFKRDGRISMRERQILARSIDRLEYRLEREMADRQGRGYRYGRRG